MTIRSSVGVARGNDLIRAVAEAAAATRRTAEQDAPKAALVLTAGKADRGSVVEAMHEAWGPIPLVGAAVDAILTDQGAVEAGASVACFFGDALNPSFAAAGHVAGLAAAADRVGRLILSGNAYRRHYPRGLALVFARPDAQGLPTEFLARWREIVGPKLRTVFSQVSSGLLYTAGSEDPGCLVVLCLEGAYQTGLGVAQGFAVGDSIPDASTLAHGAADAAVTAVKRLEGQPVRAALVAESVFRHRGLAAASPDEWHEMRERIGAGVNCVGWLTRSECASGHGVVPNGLTGSMIVAALGDIVPVASAKH